MSFYVKYISFVFILISDFEMFQSATSPKLKWPLCEKSFSYETKNGVEGVFPQLTDCFEVDDSATASFIPGAACNGLFYNGSTCSQMDIPKGNMKTTDFAFSIFIKPLILNGYVLHYKASGTSSSDITDIHISFVNGNLVYNIKKSDGNSLGEVNGSSLTVGSWSLVQFGFYKSRNLVIRVDSVTVSELNIPSDVKFLDEGTLTVGNSDDGGNGFIGTLTCLMAFDDATSFQTRSESETECKEEGNWGKRPGSDFAAPSCILPPSYPETTTTTSATFTVRSTEAFAKVNLLYVWPLDNKSFGYETIRNIAPSFTDWSSCPRIECNDTVFPFPALLFDGAAGSHIKTIINQTIFLDSFTIGFFFFPEIAPSGTILHIVDQGEMVGVNELQIDINMCNLTVTAMESDSVVCAKLITNMTKISEWNKLIVSRNKDSQILSFILNNDSIEIHDNCSTNNSPRTSKLYIGRSSTSLTSFRGYMRCMAIFDTVLIPDLKEICNSDPVTSFNASDIECNHNTTMKWMYFRKMYALMRPAVGKPEIKRMDAKQLKSCAVSCLNLRFCRSFVFDISQKLCFLYDFVTRNGLEEIESGNYYIVIKKLQQL